MVDASAAAAAAVTNSAAAAAAGRGSGPKSRRNDRLTSSSVCRHFVGAVAVVVGRFDIHQTFYTIISLWTL